MKTLTSPSDDFNRRKPGGDYLNRAYARNYNLPQDRAYNPKRRPMTQYQQKERGFQNGR